MNASFLGNSFDCPVHRRVYLKVKGAITDRIGQLRHMVTRVPLRHCQLHSGTPKVDSASIECKYAERSVMPFDASLQRLDSPESEEESRSPTVSTHETLRSLLNPSVNAILVKGEPGTGKTTFAVELLQTYGNGIYMSTRVSKEQITRQNPSISSLVASGGCD